MLQPHRSAWTDCLLGLAFAFDFPTRFHLQPDRANLLLLALDRAGHAGWIPVESAHRMLAILAEAGDLDARLSAMRRDYQRLFEFPGPKVPPYEYAYRGASTSPGETAERLRACYRAAGLKISSHFKDLPDHICLELEFLARLLEKEAEGESGEARGRRDFEESLRSWFPRFLAAIRAEARDPYYLELATLSESMFRLENGGVT